MIRAWFIGFLILLGIDLVFLVTSLFEISHRILWMLLQISPLIASFVTAYLSPRKQVLLATTLTAPTAFLGLAVTIIYQLLGKAVDFPGFKGGLILFEISLLYGFILCSLGGVIGYIFSKFGKTII